MKVFLNKKLIILYTSLAVIFVLSQTVFAMWSGTYYEPGETLNPECLPTDIECNVRPPLTSLNISNQVYDNTWDSDETHAPSKDAIYDKLETLATVSHNPLTLGINSNGLSLNNQELSLTSGYIIPTTINETNWNTAYSWGNHAGLYDTTGTASNLLSTHNSTYNHSLISTALQSESDPIFNTWLLTSPLSSYIPYTGATGNVDLGNNNLTVDTNTLFVDSVNDRVGIGTASPVGALQVVGASVGAGIAPLVVQNTNAYASPYTQFSQVWLNSAGGILASLRNDGSFTVSNKNISNYFQGNIAGSVSSPVYNSGGTGLGMYFPSSGIGLVTNSLERLTINSTGNVGIGTTNPVAKLHVSGGNILIDSNNYFKSGGSSGIKGGVLSWGTQNSAYGYDGFFGRGVYYDGSNYRYSSTNGTDHWGTNAGLWIKGSGTNALQFIARPATESGTEIIATDLDAYSRMVITYAGNVGIGTTTPSAKLDVVGMISVDNAASGDVLKINNGGYINFNNLARFRAFSTNFQFQDASFNTVAKIAVGGDNSYFNTTGGNVGIGIITPLAKLHVQDTTTLTNPGLFETAYGVNILSQISRWAILTKATNNPQYLGLGNIAGVSSGIQGYTTGNVAGNLSFQPYGGNVGIGTTSPTTLLHLVGSSATINLNNKVGFYGYYGAALAIQPLSSHSTGVLIAAHSTDQNDITKTIFRVTDNTYNTPWFNIIGGGNVGIGTTSPTSKLEVLGTVKSSSEFIITDTTNNLSTRFGALALNSQSSNTSYNSAFGNRALYNLTTGTGNTAVGKDALFNITTSGSNTAVGHQTLQLSVGGANTAVGESSLRNAGGYNASLGYGNANASYSANYGVFLGTDVAKQLTTGQMNIGIGSNTLGQVTTGEKNIAIGYSTGTTSVSGSGNNMNVMAGYYITQVVGSYNNFIGGYAGASSVGNYNSIFGFQAGNKGINGSNNLILGYASGSLISSGANLTSITNSVLIGTGVRASDNGVSNEIVIGGSAIGNGSNSVTLGSDTITKTILKGNIGIGTTSPTYKLDVVGGVRVGNDTIKLGMGESSGDSTFLGSLTNHPLKFLVNTNEYMRIATDGRIGIGITSPTEKLHIKDITGSHKLLLESNNGTSGNSYLTLQGYYSGSNSQLELRGGGSNALITGTGGNEILLRHNSGVNFQNGSSSVSFMRVSSSGVGIGTTSPSYKLSVSDTTNAGIVGSYTNSDGTCTLDPGDGSWSCSSDENLKKDITDSTLGLNELKQLRPVSFRWLSEDPSTSPTLGLIAQEVREIFPNLVHTQIDGKLSLNYGGFTPIIIKSIQDIDLKIEGLNDIDTTNTFRDVIISWLENVSNGIENIFTKKIHTETLCVKKVDGGEVCLNGDELEIIMNGGIISSNTSNIIESNQEQSSNEMETEEFYSESDLVQEVDEINQNGINSDTGDIEENNTDLVSDNEEVEENTNTSFQTNESQNISEQDSVVVLDDSSQ